MIIRYALALDHHDLDVAFLQMWSILEKITDTIGGKYDETIRRAIWGFSDYEYSCQLLDSLRYRRNQYVHSGKSGEGSEQVAYMIKSFVEPHLVRLVRNDFRVQSLAEYGKFLALPPSKSALEKQRRLYGRALKELKIEEEAKAKSEADEREYDKKEKSDGEKPAGGQDATE